MGGKLLYAGFIVLVTLLAACSAVPQEQAEDTAQPQAAIPEPPSSPASPPDTPSDTRSVTPSVSPSDVPSDTPVDTSPGAGSDQVEPLPEQPEEPAPAPPASADEPPDSSYSMERTLSDGAQRNTIAFSALDFLTGDLCADSFLPLGKVADFFGFQYLRDNTPDGMGHNTYFVTRSDNGVISILTDSQKAQMVVLAWI